MPILSVSDLSCTRMQGIIFSGLSFTLGEGRILALTGANGAGKTSALRILAGLLPGGGTVMVDGAARDFDTWPAAFHWVGTESALKAPLTVRENLEIWGDYSGYDPLGISPLLNMPVRILSHGQRRRVALSRLFLNDRPLWLLDEPETGLDAQALNALRAEIVHHSETGGSAIIATHRADVWPAHEVIQIGGYA